MHRLEIISENPLVIAIWLVLASIQCFSRFSERSELWLQASRTITIWGGISAPLFSLCSFSGCRFFCYFSPLFTISNIHKQKCNYNQVRSVLQEKMPNCAHTKNRNIQLQSETFPYNLHQGHLACCTLLWPMLPRGLGLCLFVWITTHRKKALYWGRRSRHVQDVKCNNPERSFWLRLKAMRSISPNMVDFRATWSWNSASNSHESVGAVKFDVLSTYPKSFTSKPSVSRLTGRKHWKFTATSSSYWLPRGLYTTHELSERCLFRKATWLGIFNNVIDYSVCKFCLLFVGNSTQGKSIEWFDSFLVFCYLLSFLPSGSAQFWDPQKAATAARGKSWA